MTPHTPGITACVHYRCGLGHDHTIRSILLTDPPAVGEQFRVVSSTGTHALVLRVRRTQVYQHPDAFTPPLTLWADVEGVEATGVPVREGVEPGVCCDLVVCR